MEKQSANLKSDSYVEQQSNAVVGKSLQLRHRKNVKRVIFPTHDMNNDRNANQESGSENENRFEFAAQFDTGAVRGNVICGK